MLLAFQPIPRRLLLHPYDNLHTAGVEGPVLVHHTLSCNQDPPLGDQSPAACQVPECGLLWGPLLAQHGPFTGHVVARSVIRGRADKNGRVPRPLSLWQVVFAESVQFAADCGKLRIRRKKMRALSEYVVDSAVASYVFSMTSCTANDIC